MTTWANTRCKCSSQFPVLSFQLRSRFVGRCCEFPMPNSAEQLQRLYLAGFELQTFERYPKCIGVIRNHCIALLVPGVDGLQVLGTPGWRMGEVMGVLTEREGRKVFQAKSDVVEATPERLLALQKFRGELGELLGSHS